jgi:soluble lytic murein transglycosylase
LQPSNEAAAPAPANPAFATDKSLATAEGLAALTDKRIDEARSLRDDLPLDSLDRHILAWAVALKGGDGVRRARRSPARRAICPAGGMEMLRRNSERALLKEAPEPERVLRAFGELSPQTPEGAIILARSRISLGDMDGARKALSSIWRTAKMRRRCRGGYSGRIRRDHSSRGSSLPHGAHALFRARQIGRTHRKAGQG